MKSLLILLLTTAIAFGSEFYMLDFKLFSLSNKNKGINLNNYRGKIVFLTFIKDGCPWCKKELKVFNTVLKGNEAKEVEVVVITLGNATKSLKAETKAVNYPVLRASKKLLESIGGVQVTPYTLVTDKKGNFETKIVGYQTAQEIEEIIHKLKGKK